LGQEGHWNVHKNRVLHFNSEELSIVTEGSSQTSI
jgi:hypothetical protein